MSGTRLSLIGICFALKFDTDLFKLSHDIDSAGFDYWPLQRDSTILHMLEMALSQNPTVDYHESGDGNMVLSLYIPLRLLFLIMLRYI